MTCQVWGGGGTPIPSWGRKVPLSCPGGIPILSREEGGTPVIGPNGGTPSPSYRVPLLPPHRKDMGPEPGVPPCRQTDRRLSKHYFSVVLRTWTVKSNESKTDERNRSNQRQILCKHLTYKFDFGSPVSIDDVLDDTVDDDCTDSNDEHVQLVNFFSQYSIQHIKHTKCCK